MGGRCLCWLVFRDLIRAYFGLRCWALKVFFFGLRAFMRFRVSVGWNSRIVISANSGFQYRAGGFVIRVLFLLL